MEIKGKDKGGSKSEKREEQKEKRKVIPYGWRPFLLYSLPYT